MRTRNCGSPPSGKHLRNPFLDTASRSHAQRLDDGEEDDEGFDEDIISASPASAAGLLP